MCAHRHARLPRGLRDASSLQTKKGFGGELREFCASLLDPSIWLRACSLAALRDRGDAAAFGMEILPRRLLEHIGGSSPHRITERPEVRRSGQSDSFTNY